MDLSFLRRIKASAVDGVKSPVFWAKFAGYMIPLGFLVYVLYVNFLPFGFKKTFTLNIGSENDVIASELYLEPSPGLSERKRTDRGTAYRNLEGISKAIFKPVDILQDVNVNVEVIGDSVSLLPPHIIFDPSSIKWDHVWDFTQSVPKELTNTNAFVFENGTYLNGTARLELPNSNDNFEDGPFTLYVEWMPTDSEGNGQQIIGHYNWEIWENSSSIEFRIGRMNDANGPFLSIKYPIDKSFIQAKHSVLAVYSPSEINGYIELFVDGQFADRVQIGVNKIWKDYNGKNNLTLGFTTHNYGQSAHFKGELFQARYSSQPFDSNKLSSKKITFLKRAADTRITIPVLSPLSSKLEKLILYVTRQ